MKAFIFLRFVFKKLPLQFGVSTLLLLAANLMDAASIFSLVVVIDLFINPTLQGASLISQQIVAAIKAIALPTTLGWLLAIFVIFNVLKISFQILAQAAILKMKYAVLRELMLGTFEDFFGASWNFFVSNRQGTLINTFTREMNLTGDALSALARYFSGILQIIVYLVAPFCLSWQVSSVSIITALAFALPFFLLGKISYRLGKTSTSTANQMTGVIQENLSLAKVILGFGKQQKGAQALSSAFANHRNATLRSQLLSFSVPLLYFPFGILVLVVGLLVARRSALPLSETAVLFYALSRLIPIISSLTGEKSVLDNFFPSYEQIMNLRRSAKECKQPSGTRKFLRFDKEILVEDLSFAYHGQEAALLKDINMRIPKGKMVAIVGESGAGKSTLIDVLMGFHKPDRGRVTFDGVSLRDFDINLYRMRIGYVPQDSVLFNMSILDNLLWACESATDGEIQQACRQANADEFIRRFQHGYETIVGERGVRLSGGQVQRIALARAILRMPQLLILDEATSALDTHSERLIQQAIENIAKETTVIMVAHRLSTIINADYIYVLKKGQIIEYGTYEGLIQRDGDFRGMVCLQSLEVSK